MDIIQRHTTYQTVALLTTSASPDIEISRAAWGMVAVPSAESYVTLTYYIKMGGAYYAAQDTAGAAVTQTVAADKAYPIPAVLFGAATIQIRANSAGSIRLTLKS